MTTLAANVDADDELWTLDNLPTPEAPYVEVGEELIEVRSRFPSSYYTLTGETLPPRIRVRRGIAGTTKASHIQGSTLTPNYGLGGGAGGAGVTVDNQSDPPAEVTTLIAPGAVIAGDEATLTGILLTGGETEPGHFFRGPDAPEDTPEYAAILEAGDLWTDTTGGLPFQHKVWNGASWDLLPLVFKDAEGVEVAKVSIDPVTGIIVALTEGATKDAYVRLQPGGLAVMGVGPGPLGMVEIADTGQVAIQTPWGSVILDSSGVSIGGVHTFGWASGVLLELPTVDPVEAGQLWNDAGVVKVSTG